VSEKFSQRRSDVKISGITIIDSFEKAEFECLPGGGLAVRPLDGDVHIFLVNEDASGWSTFAPTGDLEEITDGRLQRILAEKHKTLRRPGVKADGPLWRRWSEQRRQENPALGPLMERAKQIRQAK
jgi:hypothetical protein